MVACDFKVCSKNNQFECEKKCDSTCWKLCGKELKNTRGVADHKNRNHKPQPMVKCTIKICSKNKPYECIKECSAVCGTLCNKEMEKKSLSDHKKNHINQKVKCQFMVCSKNDSKSYGCKDSCEPKCPKICNVILKNQSKLKQHISTHKIGEKYICNHIDNKIKCGFSTDRKSHFDIHMRKHTGEKPYKCTEITCSVTNIMECKNNCKIDCKKECGKYFKQDTHLVEHIKIHKNNRQFICDYKICSRNPKQVCDKHCEDGCEKICGESFNRKTGGLDRHINSVHTKEKKYYCDICDYYAVRKDNLRLHFHCTLCNIGCTNGNGKYNPYCFRCWCYSNPNEPQAQSYKFKEYIFTDEVKQFIDGNVNKNKILKMTFDKKIENGKSMRRPDVYIELGTHSIILELDENSHKDKFYNCENKRSMELFRDLGTNRPLVFIRINPDAYTIGNNKISSCFSFNSNGKLILDELSWDNRMKDVMNTIDFYIKNIPDCEFTQIYKFYDEQ